ncbi:MAG: methyltransferase domain-containing protein [Ignavibacteriae bacterium]|nr:methyltransferase domain-containing protein [Ignavibacteriota bacterium]
MKDKFSVQSKIYADFRPTYPKELVGYISSYCKERTLAWDVGTGNGQFAFLLSEYFQKVYATDLSANQIENARQNSKIIYKVEHAEKSNFPDKQFDLITVAQALHWFNLEKFFTEVNRTLKPKGIFAAIGYSLIKISPDIDKVINDFYTNVIGKYWDPERKLVDEKYKNIHFPFNEITNNKHFKITADWTINNLEGYLNSWSAVQNFIKINNYNPVPKVIKNIIPLLKDKNLFKVKFPIFMRIYRLI